MDGERLQKVLAAAGVGSRRVCDQLIAEGRVTVNGKVAILGTRVDPQTAVIHVDGTRIPTRAELVVLAFHKPRGVASAMTDPKGMPCVGDFVADRPERVFHVGRLDVDTEGLLLLTNDGELAQMDVTMAGLYKRVMKNTPKADQQELKAEQRGWLEGRNDCWKAANHKACVKADHEVRIQELKDK